MDRSSSVSMEPFPLRCPSPRTHDPRNSMARPKANSYAIDMNLLLEEADGNCECRRTPGATLRISIPLHEPAVDPVLPTPYPFALERETSTGGDSVAIAGSDQRQRVFLRRPFDERLSAQHPSQVLRQRRARANRVHTGLAAWLP